MPLPSGIATVTVTGGLLNPDGATGSIDFIPAVRVHHVAEGQIVLPAKFTAWFVDGAFTIALPAADDEGGNPTGWTYHVVERVQGGSSYDISVLLANGATQDLSALAPVATSTGEPVVVGPQGPAMSDAALAAAVATGATKTELDSAYKHKPKAYGWRQLQRSSSRGALTFSPDGLRIWASDLSSARARTLSYSTDNMATWTNTVAPDPTHGPQHMLFTAAGTMLVGCAGKIYRATDGAGGTAFTMVLDLGQPNIYALPEGCTQDDAGVLYIGQYGEGNTTGGFPGEIVKVLQSVDDGLTWTTHSSFPTRGGSPADPNRIRHIHVVAALPSGLWCATGDNDVSCAIWKWVAGAWARMSPVDATAAGQRWRAVSLQERSGYLYWGKDNGAATPGEVGKAPVGDLAAYTKIADLKTGVFFGGVLPGGELIFTGAAEDGAVAGDQYCRIWVVDNTDQVWEVWRGLRNAAAIGLAGRYAKFQSGVQIAADGRILLQPTNFDWLAAPGTAYAYESILGTVDAGAGDVPTAAINPSQRLGSIRSWVSPGANDDVTTASTVSTGAAAVIPQMTATIMAARGKSYLITATCVVTHDTAGQDVTMAVILDGAAPSGNQKSVATIDVAGSKRTLTLTEVYTPAFPGARTVAIGWWVASGIATACSSNRKLTIVELAF